MSKAVKAAFGAVGAIVAVVALALALSSGSSGESSVEGHEGAFAENALREVAREGYERRKASFEVPGEDPSSGEADRGGPNSPSAQAVADRAYPRAYVDDRRAKKTLNAFKRIPSSPSARSFSHRSEYRAAATDSAWSELGPFTPNVPGEPSQFFDPETLTGPATQESGRVTALAIDPACAPGDCRMAVAAAGGGIWHTDDALADKVSWSAPPNDVPTTAFGSLFYDAPNDVLYAGSGEPNGSSDSEAGLGLFRSTDFGGSWSLVPGSADVATNRSISAIAVDPTDPNTIYIGTALARHGSSAVNGGRRTPPNAPALGVYRSTDGGQSFELEQDLADKALADPTPPDSGVDFFAGGISKLLVDPNDPDQLYAAIFGYGLWRADQSSATPSWEQVFHTMNQNDFTGADFIGDSTGDETEFDFVDLGATTRIFLGDASDDFAIDGDDATPAPRAWRNDDAAAIVGNPDGQLTAADPLGDTFNAAQGWTEMSSSDPADSGYAVYNYCQNGQCSYDSLVAHPPGSGPGTVWYLGSMNYDELKVYDRDGFGAPPRSNGRAVIRTTNGGVASPATAASWADMTAILGDSTDDWDVQSGIHPDLRAAAFANNGDTAFIAGDGGVTRVDVSSTQDQSASCGQRTWDYDADGTEDPLEPDDLALCQMLLSAVPNSISALNDGLRTIQFQSLSVNPQNPSGQIFGGTQDNGTWSYDTSRPTASRWFESVGGDGGQSGFDQTGGEIRYHNYYDATPEVNFHGDDPDTWLATYDPLQATDESRSFYTPFEVDPTTPGRLFIGLQHVWRTDDNGGDEADLTANGCNALALDPERSEPCGDWVEMGANLTSDAYGTDRDGNYVVAVERAPSDDTTLWAGTRTGRLFITSNADDVPGAVQFRRIDTPETPGRFVSGIAVDPADPNHAWVSYTGYSAYTPDTPGHVFDVTYDPATRQASFTDISYNLGDQPITGLAVYGANGSLFAGTDFGVLELPAGSTEWVEAGNGLPKVAVYGLTLAEDGRTLFAATHGRGAYSLQLPKVTPPPPPGPTTRPKVRLKPIKPVRLGHRSRFHGAVRDPAGIQSAFVKFGDGSSKKVTIRKDATFKLHHRYHKARRFHVRLVAIGSEGTKATADRNARVKPRKHRHKHHKHH